jgi:hypothetical protein
MEKNKCSEKIFSESEMHSRNKKIEKAPFERNCISRGGVR